MSSAWLLYLSIGSSFVVANDNTFCNSRLPYEDREDCLEDNCWGRWFLNPEGTIEWLHECDHCLGCYQGSMCVDKDIKSQNAKCLAHIDKKLCEGQICSGGIPWVNPKCCRYWVHWMMSYTYTNKGKLCDSGSYNGAKWVADETCCMCNAGDIRPCPYHDDTPNNGLDGCDWDDYVGCIMDYTVEGSSNCDAAMQSGFTCSQLESDMYGWDCAGCNCLADVYWVDYTDSHEYRQEACASTGNDSWCISAATVYEFEDMEQSWTGAASHIAAFSTLSLFLVVLNSVVLGFSASSL